MTKVLNRLNRGSQVLALALAQGKRNRKKRIRPFTAAVCTYSRIPPARWPVFVEPIAKKSTHNGDLQSVSGTAETSFRPGKVSALSVFSGAEMLIFSAAVSFIQCSGWLGTPISKNTTGLFFTPCSAYYATVVEVIFFQTRNSSWEKPWPHFSRIVRFEGYIHILLPICSFNDCAEGDSAEWVLFFLPPKIDPCSVYILTGS